MNRRIFRLLLDPDPNAGGGGTTKTETPTPTPTPTPPPAPDIAKQVEDVLKKHGGDQTTAVRAILTELNSTRDQLAEVRGKLPKDGAVVLDADAASAWSAYQALGKPEEITAKFNAGEAATTELAGLKRDQHFASVAEIQGFEPAVLKTLAEKDNLEIVIEEKDEKDPKTFKPIKVKVASVKGEGDKTTPLSEYAEANWKAFLPALKTTETPNILPLRGSPSANGQVPPRPPVVKSDQPRRPLVS